MRSVRARAGRVASFLHFLCEPSGHASTVRRCATGSNPRNPQSQSCGPRGARTRTVWYDARSAAGKGQGPRSIAPGLWSSQMRSTSVGRHRGRNASGSDGSSSGGSSTAGSPSRATSTSAPPSTVNACAEKASNPGTEGSCRWIGREQRDELARLHGAHGDDAEHVRVQHVSGAVATRAWRAVRALGDQQQPGAVPAGAAGRREPKVEALATDREQVRHHAGDGLGRGVAVVGRLDDLPYTPDGALVTNTRRSTPARSIRRSDPRTNASSAPTVAIQTDVSREVVAAPLSAAGPAPLRMPADLARFVGIDTCSRDVHPVVSSASSRGRMERRTALKPCKS